MPTPAERQALLFFAAIAALGIGVNAWRATRGGDAVIAGSPRELAAQIARVDSAVASSPSREMKRRKKRGERTSGSAAQGRSPATGWPRSAGVAPFPADRPSAVPAVIDIDLADIAALESLPRIGPALARRIVANRDSFGVFGSMAGLQRVRGIGPGLAKAIRDRVSFSGVPRPDAPQVSGKVRRRREAP